MNEENPANNDTSTEMTREERLAAIEKEMGPELPPEEMVARLVASQASKRAKTLRPMHMVRASRRAKNKMARKSRKVNAMGKGHKVPKPHKRSGNGHQSPRLNRNTSTASVRNNGTCERERWKREWQHRHELGKNMLPPGVNFNDPPSVESCQQG